MPEMYEVKVRIVITAPNQAAALLRAAGIIEHFDPASGRYRCKQGMISGEIMLLPVPMGERR